MEAALYSGLPSPDTTTTALLCCLLYTMTISTSAMTIASVISTINGTITPTITGRLDASDNVSFIGGLVIEVVIVTMCLLDVVVVPCDDDDIMCACDVCICVDKLLVITVGLDDVVTVVCVGPDDVTDATDDIVDDVTKVVAGVVLALEILVSDDIVVIPRVYT